MKLRVNWWIIALVVVAAASWWEYFHPPRKVPAPPLAPIATSSGGFPQVCSWDERMILSRPICQDGVSIDIKTGKPWIPDPRWAVRSRVEYIDRQTLIGLADGNIASVNLGCPEEQPACGPIVSLFLDSWRMSEDGKVSLTIKWKEEAK